MSTEDTADTSTEDTAETQDTSEPEIPGTTTTKASSPQITIQPGSSRMIAVPNAGASPPRIVVVPGQPMDQGQVQGAGTQTS
jgi:hypothetical protein